MGYSLLVKDSILKKSRKQSHTPAPQVDYGALGMIETPRHIPCGWE